MHGLFPQSLMFSYSILNWLFICLLNLKLLIDLFFFLVFVFFCFFFFFCLTFHLNYFFLIMYVFFYSCLIFVFPSFFVIFHFTRDVRQPLSQIRLSLSVSLGVGQLIFLAGVNATEHTVRGISDLFIYLIKSFCQDKNKKTKKHISFSRLLVSQ